MQQGLIAKNGAWFSYQATTLAKRNQVLKREAGFTLIELVIVVAIIGMLAAIAVPNFISYRNKSRVAAVVSTCEGIRAALTNYAADSMGNLFPLKASIDTAYDQLVLKVNRNGGALPTDPAQISIESITYESVDGSDYTLTIKTMVSDTFLGRTLVVTPAGIVRQ